MSFICAVCLDLFDETAEVVDKYPVAITCGHVFHSSCVSDWFKKQKEKSSNGENESVEVVEGESNEKVVLRCPFSCPVVTEVKLRLYLGAAEAQPGNEARGRSRKELEVENQFLSEKLAQMSEEHETEVQNWMVMYEGVVKELDELRLNCSAASNSAQQNADFNFAAALADAEENNN